MTLNTPHRGLGAGPVRRGGAAAHAACRRLRTGSTSGAAKRLEGCLLLRPHAGAGVAFVSANPLPSGHEGASVATDADRNGNRELEGAGGAGFGRRHRSPTRLYRLTGNVAERDRSRSRRTRTRPHHPSPRRRPRPSCTNDAIVTTASAAPTRLTASRLAPHQRPRPRQRARSRGMRRRRAWSTGGHADARAADGRRLPVGRSPPPRAPRPRVSVPLANARLRRVRAHGRRTAFTYQPRRARTPPSRDRRAHAGRCRSDVEVRNPSGVAVPIRRASRGCTLGPGDVPPLGAALFEEGRHVQLVLANPRGRRLDRAVTLPGGSPETFGTSPRSWPAGSASAWSRRVRTTSPATRPLAVVAFDGTATVTGASVTANVYQEGAEDSPIVVTPWTTASRPTRRRTTASTRRTSRAARRPLPGRSRAAVRRRGARPPARASRSSARLARFTGAATDQGVDTNGDGLFEHVALSLEVEVDEPGTYSAHARLLRGRTSARSSAGAEAGSPPGPLRRDRALRRRRHQEVPGGRRALAITDAVLTRLDDATRAGARGRPPAPRSASPARTRSRSSSGPSPSSRPGCVDAGSTPTPTGCSTCCASGSSRHAPGGGYTWTGDLRAPDGTVLGIASGQAFLDAGRHAPSSSCSPACPSGESGQNGPYTVGNVAVYGPPRRGGRRSTSWASPSRTSVTQFEGSAQVTFDQLIAAVKAVPITNGFPPRAGPPQDPAPHGPAGAEGRPARAPAAGHAVLLNGFIDEVQVLAQPRASPRPTPTAWSTWPSASIAQL